MSDKKKCPFCAETIKAEAVICRFCGRELSGEPAEKSPEQPPPKHNSAIMIPAILFMLAGCYLFFSGTQNFILPVSVFGVGIFFVVFGLATGKVKFLG